MTCLLACKEELLAKLQINVRVTEPAPYDGMRSRFVALRCNSVTIS